MPTLYVPATLRRLADGHESLTLDGSTVREVLAAGERRFPGLCDAILRDERLRPGLVISVDGAIATLGLRQPVANNAELHILPAIGGG